MAKCYSRETLGGVEYEKTRQVVYFFLNQKTIDFCFLCEKYELLPKSKAQKTYIIKLVVELHLTYLGTCQFSKYNIKSLN